MSLVKWPLHRGKKQKMSKDKHKVVIGIKIGNSAEKKWRSVIMLEAVCDKLVVHTSVRIGEVQPAHRQRAMFVVSVTNNIGIASDTPWNNWEENFLYRSVEVVCFFYHEM